jgi:hypothetical protein
LLGKLTVAEKGPDQVYLLSCSILLLVISLFLTVPSFCAATFPAAAAAAAAAAQIV